MSKNKTAELLFKQYRAQTENAAQTYNSLKALAPFKEFPTTAQRVWKDGMLAEIWGIIASLLSKDKRNYLAEWREGKYKGE